MGTVKKMKLKKNIKTAVATATHTCVRNWIKVKGKYIAPRSTGPVWFLFDQMAYIR